MDRRTALTVTLLTIVLTLAGPILLALHLAQRDALVGEAQRALAQARGVLSRADATPDEISRPSPRLPPTS